MRIKRLAINNFKGLKSIEIEMNGEDTELLGRNGAGKTSIADAITWCLFAKNSEDVSDFGVRPVDADKEAVTEVTIETMSGDTITRRLKEDWSRPKGKEELKFKGLVTECEWNLVPMKVTAFKAKVGEMFDVTDELFRLCTRPEAFTSLKWQAQKTILIDIAGEPSKEEIGMEDFLKELNGKSLEEFNKSLSKKKSLLKDKINQLPARIDEADRMRKTATEEDKQAYADVVAEIYRLQTPDNDQEERINRHNEIKAKIHEINNAKFTAKNQHNQKRAAIDSEYAIVCGKLNRMVQDREEEEHGIRTLESRLNVLRAEYVEEANKQFTDNGICPTCGQPYTAEKVDEMRAEWNNQHANTLKEKAEGGKKLAEKIEQIKDNLAAFDTSELEAKKAELKTTIDNFGAYDSTEFDAQLTALMNEEKELIANNGETFGKAERLKDLEVRKSHLEALINVEAFNESIEKRISQLRDEQQQANSELALLEKQEYQAKQYATRMIELLEERINGMFKTVKFKFSKPTLEDGYVETCIATINGVEYKDLNTASKINAGIEIINVLSEHYKVDAPLIIDNKERVTNIVECRQQVICLTVDAKTDCITKKL